MYRTSSSSENRTLEHPSESLVSAPRYQKNYARHGILATALLLGLTLVLTTFFAWRDTEALTDTVSEGQSELYLRAFRDFSGGPPTDRAFQLVVDTYAESGLRGAGQFDSEGTFTVMAGAFSEPLPQAVDRPHGRTLLRIGNRYRILVHLPPGGPPPEGPPPDHGRPDSKGPHGRPPPPHKRPPPPAFDGRPMPPPPPPPPDEGQPPNTEPGHPPMEMLAFEFEPLLATGLTQRARMTFFLSTGVAALLALAAVVLWRRAEREEALGTRLAQAERLASLGTMSAVLAHEIKNPLASLKGNAQLLAESLSPESRSRSQADRVVEAALRLQGLVQNLLDFARGGPIERAEADPAELLFLAAEDAAPSATLDLDQAPATWSLDAIRLRQVLENLLRNALQASKQGNVKARVFVESDNLVYVVEDDGPGFPPEVLENVFEPFFTTKSRGVGLGLAVARRIIFMHGGTVSARNKAEGGAELTVSIPRMRSREEGSNGAGSRSG
jgi:two-component system, NtrC family, sensor histidine kinase HydH